MYSIKHDTGARTKRYLNLLGSNKNTQARLVLERLKNSKVVQQGKAGAKAAARKAEAIGSKIAEKIGKSKMASSVINSISQGKSKAGSFYDMFKKSKVLQKIGRLFSKVNVKAPVHLIDSMITYAIGVVSGLQDMMQVRVSFLVLCTHYVELFGYEAEGGVYVCESAGHGSCKLQDA